MSRNLGGFGILLLLPILGMGCGDNLMAAHGDAPVADAPSLVDAHAGGTADAPSGAPSVISTSPADNTSGVALDDSVVATFSQPMDRTTLTTASFTVVAAVGGVAVTGTVVPTTTTVAFIPGAHLAASTSYIATITTAAANTAGHALSAPYTWHFQTGTTTSTTGIPIDLGTAGNFVLLGKSGITNVPTSMITGDIGVSPITSTAITGFPLTPDPSNQFDTTPQVIGRVYAADFAAPTPANMTAAIDDMETAFATATARAPDVTELGAGMIGSQTLAPGVYKWSSALLIPTDLTLSGSATDVWIFEIAQGLTLSSGTRIILAGGALAKNIFWQSSGAVVVNAGAHLEGNVLSLTAATLDTGASLNGRLLAQTLVTVRASTITEPAP